MAASFIILAALPGTELKLSTFARLAGLTVAVWTLVATEVRTGLVAVAIGLLLHLALSRKARTWVRMIALTPFAIILAIIAFPAASSTSSGFAALQSLLTNPFDSRFTYRFHTWDQAIAMINSRPILGWGPGSAGDTLEPFFRLAGT
jgi:O-antigen ligase